MGAKRGFGIVSGRPPKLFHLETGRCDVQHGGKGPTFPTLGLQVGNPVGRHGDRDGHSPD